MTEAAKRRRSKSAQESGNSIIYDATLMASGVEMDKQTKLKALIAKKEEIEARIKDPKLCEGTATVYARITGYYRSVSNWNRGKAQEFKEREAYTL